MGKLGVLGLGSRSTLFYLKELNRLYLEKHGGYSTFPLVLLNTNFNTINPLLPNTSQELKKVVQEYIMELEDMQLDSILVPNITLHDVIDSLEPKTQLHHPLSLTLVRLQECPVSKLSIIGSEHTMTAPYCKDYFAKFGIEIIPLPDNKRALIDQLRKKVYEGKEREDEIKAFNELIEGFSKDRALVIACTELSIVNYSKASNVFDMARIQIESCLHD